MNHFNNIYKRIALVACTTLLIQVPAEAATMLFNPDSASGTTGAIDVVLPMDKMGSLPLPRGRVKINGNKAELSIIPEWQFDRDIVLYGNVLDTSVDSSGKQPIVRGVIIWTDGSWIDYFDDHKPSETIIANNTLVRGRVTEVTNSDIAVEAGGSTKRTPITAITEIRSPRVFSFAIPTTALQPRTPSQPYYSDARSITMQATGSPFRLAALKKTVNKQMDDGDWSTARLIGIGTALSLVEFGSIVPTFAVPLGLGPRYGSQLKARSYSVDQQQKSLGN